MSGGGGGYSFAFPPTIFQSAALCNRRSPSPLLFPLFPPLLLVILHFLPGSCGGLGTAFRGVHFARVTLLPEMKKMFNN